MSGKGIFKMQEILVGLMRNNRILNPIKKSWQKIISFARDIHLLLIETFLFVLPTSFLNSDKDYDMEQVTLSLIERIWQGLWDIASCWYKRVYENEC